MKYQTLEVFEFSIREKEVGEEDKPATSSFFGVGEGDEHIATFLFSIVLFQVRIRKIDFRKLDNQNLNFHMFIKLKNIKGLGPSGLAWTFLP